MTRIEITHAAFDVLVERRRQIEAEGWTPEHDNQHDKGELAEAASCYSHLSAWMACSLIRQPENAPVPRIWPWSPMAWHPSADQRRNLVKAGALILAEIERLDRQAEGGR